MKKIINITLAIVMMSVNLLYAQRTITLLESRQLALQNNAGTKNSRLEIEAARQTKKSAFTNYFPTISGTALSFRAQDPLMKMETKGGNLPVYDGNPAHLHSATQFAYFPGGTTELLKKATFGYITIMQPVFAGGRIYNGNKLAGLGVEVKELQDKVQQNEILLKTEEQYRQILSLEEKYKTILKYEEMLNSIKKQVEDAYNQGLATRNDVLKVKLKLSELLLNKSKLENGKKLAAMAFCQYIGITYEEGNIYSDVMEVTDTPQNNFTPHNEALKNRNEYALLEKSVEAEKLQTKLKLGEYLPQAGIGVNGMYMKMDDAKERTIGLIYGTLSVPISAWWGGSHELEERSVKEDIARNNFKNNSELLLLQMEKAWQDLSDAYKQYQLSIQAKEQAEENLNVNEDSYKNGLITISDLLDAQALYQQTQDQLTDAKANYLIKRTSYLQVTGR